MWKTIWEKEIQNRPANYDLNNTCMTIEFKKIFFGPLSILLSNLIKHTFTHIYIYIRACIHTHIPLETLYKVITLWPWKSSSPFQRQPNLPCLEDIQRASFNIFLLNDIAPFSHKILLWAISRFHSKPLIFSKYLQRKLIKGFPVFILCKC